MHTTPTHPHTHAYLIVILSVHGHQLSDVAQPKGEQLDVVGKVRARERRFEVEQIARLLVDSR